MNRHHRPETAVSSETAFVLDSDEIHLLTEIGFLAAGAGDLHRAATIFNALQQLRPERGFPLVGLAVAHLNAGKSAEAVALLERVHLASPGEQALLDAWRGFALQLSGHLDQSRRLLETVMQHDNGDGAALARALLGHATPHNDGNTTNTGS